MKSRFHDWGKVSCFLLYSIISAIYCHKLIGLNSEIKAKSYFLLLILSWNASLPRILTNYPSLVKRC